MILLGKFSLLGPGIWLPCVCCGLFTAMHPALAAKLSNPGVSQCNLSNKGCVRPFWYLGLTRASSSLAASQPPHQATYLPARLFPVPGSTIKSLLGPVAHPLLSSVIHLWIMILFPLVFGSMLLSSKVLGSDISCLFSILAVGDT